MSEHVYSGLQKIIRGAGVTFFGNTFSLFINFIFSLIIVRIVSQNDVGTYFQSVVIVNILILIANFGFSQGTPRFIGIYWANKEHSGILQTIKTTIVVTFIASVICFLSILIFSAEIATVFHNPSLEIPLQILAISIPTTVLIQSFSAIFRGFGNADPGVIFEYIIKNIFFLLFVITFHFFWNGLPGIVAAYSLSSVITCVLFTYYFFKNIPLENLSTIFSPELFELYQMLALVIFSIPLLVNSMLYKILNWSDTLLLSYFSTPGVVGVYSVVSPIAHLIPIILSSFGILFIPIIAGYYAKRMISEINQIFQIITKWIFIATLPIFLVIFIYPEFLLSFLFGSSYVEGALALKVLSIGFIFHTLCGPNSLCLVVLGETKHIMYSNLLAAFANVCSNIILIPKYGILGAAFSSLLAYWLLNAMNGFRLYRMEKIQPFSRNYMKILFFSVVILCITEFFKSLIPQTLISLIVVISIIIVSFIFFVILSESIDEHDAIVLDICKDLAIDANNYVKQHIIKQVQFLTTRLE